MKITLYKTTTCPKCKILKQKLDLSGLDYEECFDKEKMIELKISKVPVLDVDENKMEFAKANAWINERINNK